MSGSASSGVRSVLVPSLDDEGLLESSLEEGQVQTRKKYVGQWTAAAVSACLLFACVGAMLISHRAKGRAEVVTHNQPAVILAASPGSHCGEQQLPPPGGQCNVSILHLSDTHSMHWSIEHAFTLPKADILLHTGDVSNFGTDGEIANFDQWIGQIKDRFKHLYIVSGNHDWIRSIDMVNQWHLPAEETLAPDFMQRKLKNIEVIDFKTVEPLGLKIYGSGWCPWFWDATPGDEHSQWCPSRSRIFDAYKKMWTDAQNSSDDPPMHRYDEIPEDVDILMTHGPSWHIFDEIMSGHWGSSQNLRRNIEQKRPKIHLFGHVHEQRGEWHRWDSRSNYTGGAEYEPVQGSDAVFKGRDPPVNYTVDLVSNNAMMSNPMVDGSWGHWQPAHIKGPARLITAQWSGNRWHFTL